jgi:palmitoyltransferase
MEVQESRQYSALSFSAFKNHMGCFDVVLEHAKTYNLNKDSPSFSKLRMKDWVNKTTDEDFTAIHFASYHGNLELIIRLVDLEADIYMKNMYGANVMLIASQGDNPAPIYYFAKVMKLDLNISDHRGSTALHWACFARSEFALSYILALNPNLEVKDNSGNTPLHLAIKSVA